MKRPIFILESSQMLSPQMAETLKEKIIDWWDNHRDEPQIMGNGVHLRIILETNDGLIELGGTTEKWPIL